MKVVQTEISSSSYESLKKISEEKKLTIKETLREAIKYYIQKEYNREKDSFFSIKPVAFKKRINNKDIDAVLYGEKDESIH